MRNKSMGNIQRIPTVGVIILDGNSVLLVEHGEGAGHLTGSLGTPGGRVDAGETNVQAAVRELKEETGLDVKEEDLKELPGEYEADLPRKNGEILYVSHTVFASNRFSGELRGTDEAVPVWFPINSLKDRELLPNIEDMVEKAQRLLREN